MPTATKKNTFRKAPVKQANYYERAVLKPAQRLIALLSGKSSQKPVSR